MWALWVLLGILLGLGAAWLAITVYFWKNPIW